MEVMGHVGCVVEVLGCVGHMVEVACVAVVWWQFLGLDMVEVGCVAVVWWQFLGLVGSF